jgi:uncharacterized protein YdhG (YjbR/CyaY superfamily)
MKRATSRVLSIEQYIASCPTELQPLLERTYQTIRKAAPGATEAIKYGMPTFVLHGNLVHFAACKGHLGFYPTPSGIEQFREALAGYQTSKGAIQFPLDRPIPQTLIAKIVRFRVRENVARAAAKARRR